MIVRREGGGWTLINQTDHAKHCGEIARAWQLGPYGATSVSKSLQYAAEYHDLGWAEADQKPETDGEGRPRNFTQADEARHTAFYSQAVRTISRTDLYAAYLVSLHASGLYSRRYGWMGLNPVDWSKIGPDGQALLDGERKFRAEVVGTVSPAEIEFEATWRNYMLLETFDYLSLLTCYGFSSTFCGPVPTLEGQWEQLSIRRLGPLEVELSPFPFLGDSLEVPVTCTHVAQARFESDHDLRSRVSSSPSEVRQTVYRAGAV
jgi:uncharacterized protein DUF3891